MEAWILVIILYDHPYRMSSFSIDNLTETQCVKLGKQIKDRNKHLSKRNFLPTIDPIYQCYER